MKNILVTGAGGFIGSHLTELLVEKGYTVKAFVHYNSWNKWGWLEIITGDIRD
jgi:nucleoside-diphosphate-sugar epimerase